MAEPGRKVRALNERRDNLRDKQTEMQQKIKILQNVIKENEAKMRELAAESQQLDQGLEEVESAQIQLFDNASASQESSNGIQAPNTSIRRSLSVAQSTAERPRESPGLAPIEPAAALHSLRPGFEKVEIRRCNRKPVRIKDFAKCADGTGLMFSADQTAIVKLAQGWAEIWCHICGANGSAQKGAHYMGVNGLTEHVRSAHGASFDRNEILQACGIYYLTDEEYSAFCHHKLMVRKVLYNGKTTAAHTQLPDRSPARELGNYVPTKEVDEGTILEQASCSRLFDRVVRSASHSPSQGSDSDLDEVPARLPASKQRRTTEPFHNGGLPKGKWEDS